MRYLHQRLIHKLTELPPPVINILLALTATILLTVFFLPKSPLRFGWQALQALENKLYDYRVFFSIDANTTVEYNRPVAKNIIDDKIVIIDIDEASLAELGSFRQWPRAYFGQVVDTLATRGARAIGFDVIFSEPDQISESSARFFAHLVRQITTVDSSLALEVVQSISTDSLMAESLKKAGNVYLASHFWLDPNVQPEIQTFPDQLAQYRFSNHVLEKLEKDYSDGIFIPPIPVLQQASCGIGLVHIDPDADGVIRRYPLFFRYHGQAMLNLGLVMVLDYLYEDNSTLQIEPGKRVIGRTIYIPTDQNGNLLIKFHGPPRTIRTFSFAGILTGRDKFDFKDKLCLVGASAFGLEDLKTTPVSKLLQTTLSGSYPGVELHATVMHNILNNEYVWKGRFFPLTFFIAFALATTLAFSIYHFQPIRAVFLSLVILFAYVILCFLLFYLYDLWIEITFPLVTSTLTLIFVLTYRYWAEHKDKRKIRDWFDSYVSPQIVNQLMKNPGSIRFGGDKRVLTVMFTDIRDFTTMTEMMDSELLVSFLNEYLTAMHDIVNQYEGTLDKYIGDAVMALFGAPFFQENHAERACRTALDMIRRVNELNRFWQQRHFPTVQIGIGVNTGEMHVGNMGSQRRFDYTVMGDNVNLASRLEGLNKFYKTQIIVGPETYLVTKKIFEYRELDLVRVKGKLHPVKIYELLDTSDLPERRREFLFHFEQGLKAYRQRDWTDAIAQFQQCLKIQPDDAPSRLYTSRCQNYQTDPPRGDWDGAWDMTEK